MINSSKFTFSKEEIDFLGHRITIHGIALMQEKMQVIENQLKLATIVDLKQFLKIFNFYRWFIEKCEGVGGGF